MKKYKSFSFTIYKNDFRNNSVVFVRLLKGPNRTICDENEIKAYIKYRFSLLKAVAWRISIYDLLQDIGVLESYLVNVSGFPEIKDTYGWIDDSDKFDFSVYVDPSGLFINISFYNCTPFCPSISIEPGLKDFEIKLGISHANVTLPWHHPSNPEIKKVIFNPPATIVFWKDGSEKTIVKCREGEVYTPEAGLAFCVMKKLYGKDFHKQFKKWCPKEETKPDKKPKYTSYEENLGAVGEAIEKSFSELAKISEAFVEMVAENIPEE